MPYRTVFASTLVLGVVTGAAIAAASVIAMQSLGLWVEPPSH